MAARISGEYPPVEGRIADPLSSACTPAALGGFRMVGPRSMALLATPGLVEWERRLAMVKPVAAMGARKSAASVRGKVLRGVRGPRPLRGVTRSGFAVAKHPSELFVQAQSGGNAQADSKACGIVWCVHLYIVVEVAEHVADAALGGCR
jgi:hypothetical protein